MSEEMFLPGSDEGAGTTPPDFSLPGSAGGDPHGGDNSKEQGNDEKPADTVQDRLTASTRAGGLVELPASYDDTKGDWMLLKSGNPFEILYLQYKLAGMISPAMVKNNHAILETFWNRKVTSLKTGANQSVFKNKYGEDVVENSRTTLKRALEKLSSEEGIKQYYLEVNNARLKKGEENLRDSIEHMLLDGSAEKVEIELCLRRGAKYDLSAEETATIIKKNLDAGQFLPYGTVLGDSLPDQLLSTEWMTASKKEEAERVKKELASTSIQILPGKYARTVQEIGSILFDDPDGAKEMIREDLIKSAVAQKDMVLGREVGSLSKQTNTDLAYYSIVYRLNPSLPYRFQGQQKAKTVEELCNMIFETAQTAKLGKEQLKKGFIEIWLKETNRNKYEQFLKIRDNAANVDLAFIEFIYTFNPSLPYRFNNIHLVKTPKELCYETDKSAADWEAGKKELFDGSVPVWLLTTHQTGIVTAWNKVKDQFADDHDIGLEYFLHLLNDKLEHTSPSVNMDKIDYPKIQSGQIIHTDIILTNNSRGALKAAVQFSKEIPGVYLSAGSILLSNASGIKQASVALSIDSTVLLKGVHYETTVLITTFEQQKIELPVSFKIVFPQNAFLLETAKYAGIFAAFFGLLRFLIAQRFPNWMGSDFHGFLGWSYVSGVSGMLVLFGWTFFIFLAAIGTGIYFLIKYLMKNG